MNKWLIAMVAAGIGAAFFLGESEGQQQQKLPEPLKGGVTVTPPERLKPDVWMKRKPEFSQEILDPLRNERDGSLVAVARVYIEAGGNLNEAARRLSIHRNTMLYKLERIGRLLRRDVRAPDTQFTIWLAMRLSTLAATAEMVDRDVSSG